MLYLALCSLTCPAGRLLDVTDHSALLRTPWITFCDDGSGGLRLQYLRLFERHWKRALVC
jgi:hypothetical protein